MNKKKMIVVIAGGVILLGIATAGAVYMVSKIPPRFDRMSDADVLAYMKTKKAENLDQKNLLSLSERLAKITPEQRRAAMGTLSGEERKNAGTNRRLVMEAGMKKTVDEFFALPPEQQDAFLDSQIQRMEERRRTFAAGFGGRGSPGQPGSGMTRTETGAARGNFRGMAGRNRNPDAMLQRRRNGLSESSPEERAKIREYFRRLMERRRQTGQVPAFPPPR